MGKPKQEHVYFFWSTAIILCMLLAFFALLFASCSHKNQAPPEETDPSLASIQPYDPNATHEVGQIGVIETPTPGIDPNDPNGNAGSALLGETADMGQDYIDSIVFLGDSTTYGLAYYDVVDDSQVWTPASGTLSLFLWSVAKVVYEDGTELTIAEAVSKKQPEYMVITLGVNGVATMDEAAFKSDYTNLVEAIKTASPDTKIILNSIYPVTAAYPESTGITNEKILAANKWVQKIAEDTGCKYLDSASVLKDENGFMPSSISNDNQLHLNTDGFDLLINYIRTHGYI